MAKDADCDFNGIWAARQITVNSAGFAGNQFANNYYYLEIQHDGETLTVSKHFDCGIKVLGAATVILSRASLEALMQHNVQTGRKGKAYKDGSKCHFELERFWSIRGADESRFVPSPRNSTMSMADAAASMPIPTSAAEGAEDWENDGQPGSAWQVSGAATGTRNTVQRDWTQYSNDDTYSISPAMDWTNDVKVRAQFDSEEKILHATNPLLNAGSTPNGSEKHNLTLKFLGRSLTDARAKALIKDADVDTCFAVQQALPAQQKL